MTHTQRLILKKAIDNIENNQIHQIAKADRERQHHGKWLNKTQHRTTT